MTNLNSIFKSRDITNKHLSSQSYSFFSSCVWMWELDYKESWVPKNWFLWTVVLEKTLESPLDCKEIQPVHSKGDQPWVFFGRNDPEAETPILWPPDVKNWFIGKDPDAEKDWMWEEKGTTEDEMAGWHYWLNGHEFEQAPRVGDGQGCLTCRSPWGHKESDTTERLNWTELNLAKNPPSNAGDLREVDSLPGLERSPGRGNGNPLWYLCQENTMDRDAWQATSPWCCKESDTIEVT